MLNSPPSTLSDTDLASLTTKHAKSKTRSQETTITTHLPLLTTATPSQYTTLLFGSSMLERFKTTGVDLSLNSAKIFNAGVGGDTIPNVLYRITLGILAKVRAQPIEMVLINIGSNDFKKGRVFSETQIWEFALLIENVRRAFEGKRVVVSSLFYRSDVEREVVDRSNRLMEEAVRGMEGVEWMEVPGAEEGIGEGTFDDHVHLNREGYEIWDKWLVERLGLEQ